MNIKLLLLDFDCSLTSTHTTGALCFSNVSFDHHLPPEFGKYDERVFSSNNATRDPRFLIEILLGLVEMGICVSIVTMSDQQHEHGRMKQLNCPDLIDQYRVLAGKGLVMHWLYCIAMRAYNYDKNLAESALTMLFASNRFHIVAKFNDKSKQQHFAESVAYFQNAGTLDTTTLLPEQVGYADDSIQFLSDMEKHFSGINTFWIPPGGITKTIWKQIATKFEIDFIMRKTENEKPVDTTCAICRSTSAMQVSDLALAVK